MVLVASLAKDKSATINLHLRLTTLFAVFFALFCFFSPRSSGRRDHESVLPPLTVTLATFFLPSETYTPGLIRYTQDKIYGRLLTCRHG